MILTEHVELRMYPNFLLAFNSPPRKNYKRYEIRNERTNTKGELSNISRRKIRNAVNNLLLISEPQSRFTDTGNKFTFKINFITLTLPSSQIHTDHELKRILNEWLSGISRRGRFDYVWKAEKQKNGNIHFHITSNRYLHHSDIRRSWNTCLAKIGYIDRYRNTQNEWHKNGFKVRKDVFRFIRGKRVKWPREAQLKAYKQGVSENWSNPNTTDVHSVVNINDLSAYLCEYIAKNKGDKVNGRLWGCSRSLLKKPRNLDSIEITEATKYFDHKQGRGGFHWWILPRRYIESTILNNCVTEFKQQLKNELPESCPLKLDIDPLTGQLNLNLPEGIEPKQPPNPQQLTLEFG